VNEASDFEVPPLALGLSYAGLLPFGGLAVLLVFGTSQWTSLTAKALLAYGGLIASFLGGIHWSIAQRGGSTKAATGLYLWGVTPSLVAWCAVVIPFSPGLILVSALLVCCYGVDRIVYPRQGLAHWVPLRGRLTIVATLSCLVSPIAIAIR
jgi:hypothetical protein